MPQFREPVANVAAWKQRSKHFLERSESLRADAQEFGDGSFFEKVARQWMTVAAADYVGGAPGEKVLAALTVALNELQQGFELGHMPDPENLLEYFCIALVLGVKPFAQFIASWSNAYPDAPDIPINEARIAFGLLRGQDEVVNRNLEELSAQFEDSPFASFLPNELGVHRATGELLRQLANKDASAFQEALQARLNLIKASASNNPASCWDILGLGLCRLARLRGLTVNISHPFLPLSLLDACPWPSGAVKPRP
jgi:hypothetical protein